MKDIERKDLVNAVLASRDEIDPHLATELLKAIVDAEIDFALNGDAAIYAIDAALTAAVHHGVHDVQEADATDAIRGKVNRVREDEENGA